MTYDYKVKIESQHLLLASRNPQYLCSALRGLTECVNKA